MTLRAAAFVAVLQAAGIPLFLWLFGADVPAAARAVRRLAWLSAAAALLATIAAHAVQPARMTGTFGGVLDGSLHAILLASDAGTAHALRILGLVMILAAAYGGSRLREAAGLAGAMLVATSFAFAGHTVTHDLRWVLACLLVLHVLVAAFWLGSLWPLHLASRVESARSTGDLLERFSASAMRLVPLIFVAGLAMAIVLLEEVAGLLSGYGLLLVGKAAGFAALMGLAALNKWRLGPAISAGRGGALFALRRSLAAEWLLIAAVLGITAVMTAFFSPGMTH